MGDPKPIAAATLVGPTLNVDMRRSDQRIALSLPTIRVAAGPDMLKFATLYPPDGRVVIGRDVWLGARVMVMPGVTIGDGCVVGAGSVVTSDLPTEAIAVGTPARVVGNRRDTADQQVHDIVAD